MVEALGSPSPMRFLVGETKANFWVLPFKIKVNDHYKKLFRSEPESRQDPENELDEDVGFTKSSEALILT